MAFSGTGTLVASIVSKMTSSAAMVKAGGAVSGTILAGSKGLILLTQSALGSATSALGALKVGTILSGFSASTLAASPIGEEPALVGREKKSDFRFSFPAAGKAARRQRKEGQSKIYLKGFEFSRAMTVAAVPPALSAVGFTASGIAASSLAAKMMSLSAIANGGGVPAGGLVAILQSAGAAGLSVPSTVIVGSAGSAVVASVMNICESFYPFLMGSEVADMATEVADMAIEVADISTEEALPNLSNTEKD
ncbi:interferon, alpha-inducible protein 27 like 1 isoform 2 [Mus musculus]|uniref:Interferon, alpha-inducible protein 27 n=1 Tax=Mus musculus TaxID=10090 RepID=E9Q1C5_MOUSE|nr:interferon, alpha-inducible protein 27 like 1 isoform 2 [Mus musculus]|eukprot:NP_919042.2 interferon, alpha-inducible protein 27 like 1 isoform 2 [Mus musculus]